MRLDSSNYDPMLGWTHGAQMVALNMQVRLLKTQYPFTFTIEVVYIINHTPTAIYGFVLSKIDRGTPRIKKLA